MLVSPNDFVDRVVKRLRKRVGHSNDGSWNYFFLIAFEKFLLLMGKHLNLFKIWFTSSLSKNTFIFTAWSRLQISLSWVIQRHRWNFCWFVIQNFKVKDFERIKFFQIIETYWRVSFNLFQERCDISFILKGKLQHRLLKSLLVTVELEFYVSNIVLSIIILIRSCVLGDLEILGDLVSHIFPWFDAISFNPSLKLFKSSSSSQPADHFVTCPQEDAHKTSSHGKVIVLKVVPLRLGLNLCEGGGWDNNLITINLSNIPGTVLSPHFVHVCFNQIGSLVLNSINEALLVRWVTHTLEELDTLLSL